MRKMNSRIASRIRRYRLERGITLNQLSERTGIAASTLSAMETNKSSPTLNTLINIAKVFNVRAGEFLDAVAYPSARSIPLVRVHKETQDQVHLKYEEDDTITPTARLDARVISLAPNQPDLSVETIANEMIITIISGSVQAVVDGETYIIDGSWSVHTIDATEIVLKNPLDVESSVLVVCVKS